MNAYVGRCPLCQQNYPRLPDCKHTCSPEDIAKAIDARIAALRAELRHLIAEQTMQNRKAGA